MITGTPNTSGTASFAINIGGRTCTLTRTVNAGAIGSIACLTATNNGTLTRGLVASGVSSDISYTGGNGGLYSAQTITSTGVTGLSAVLVAGNFAVGNGTLSYSISGTPATSGTANFAISIGGQSCTLARTVVEPPAAVGSLSCGTGVCSNNLVSGVLASGVTAPLTYNGGNGGSYTNQSVPSTGVTGLTASINGGNILVGSGTLVFSITGTPGSVGWASFPINIAGKVCTIRVSVNCPPSAATSVVNVVTVTGKTWMDRNLGASRAATSATDASAFGDLYQWGRAADGHQCRTSPVSSTLSTVTNPNYGCFIVNNSGNYNWLATQDNNLWQGVNGVNNPCPTGYRLPTSAEYQAEVATWTSANSVGAFASPLKLTIAMSRSRIDAVVGSGSSTAGHYWTSTVSTIATSSVNVLYFSTNANSANASNGMYGSRAEGRSVRCIRN